MSQTFLLHLRNPTILEEAHGRKRFQRFSAAGCSLLAFGPIDRGSLRTAGAQPAKEDRRLWRCRPFLERVRREELRQRTYEVFRNLGEWLQTKTEQDIERRYVTIGERRAAQGITLDQLISSVMATKAHLWDYVAKQTEADRLYEFVQEMELFRVEQFFDRAAYFEVIGYECHHTGHRRPGTKWEET
jgi:hypothetical protein